MLTGRLPFAGAHEVSTIYAILHDDPPPPSLLNEGVPATFDDMIGVLLQKNAADRYPTAEALLADALALQNGAAPAYRTSFWKRTSRRRRARKALLAAAALGAFGVVTGVVWYRGTTMQARAPSPEGRAPVVRFIRNTAIVGTSAELLAALVPANAGRHIRLRAGTYDVVQPVTVPDGMTLEGEGVMRFDPTGHPTGFSDETRTTLRMTSVVGGDIVTLGHRATIRNMEIVDLAGRSGNVLAVVSRRPRDSVSAEIIESVIVNPNPLTIGAGGSLGRALYVTTRNPKMGADPAPDKGSAIAVRLLRSVLRSPVGGGGIFAYNFSANSKISVEITGSVVGGSNEANGGVSRPDAVHDSEVHITSQDNVYRNEWEDRCASALIGWNLTGGSGAPIPLALPETARNRLRLRSVNDRIDGFTTGVLATGSRRFFAAPLNAAPRSNHIDLQLVGTTILTPPCAPLRQSENRAGIPTARLVAVADLQLIGAWVQHESFAAGDGNTVRAELQNVTGSGALVNKYAHTTASSGPLLARLEGTGNRLEIVGNAQTFARQNRGINPAPAAQFFIGPR